MKRLGTTLGFCLITFSLVSLFPCCGNGDNGTQEGCDGCPCYPNGTCDSGLVCNVSNICEEDTTQQGCKGCPCYPNETCDAGLVCNASNICEEETSNPCEGVTCSGHGTCEVVGDQATCNCDSGYHAQGLNCMEDTGISKNMTISATDNLIQYREICNATPAEITDVPAGTYTITLDSSTLTANQYSGRNDQYVLLRIGAWEYNDPDRIYNFVMLNGVGDSFTFSSQKTF